MSIEFVLSDWLTCKKVCWVLTVRYIVLQAILGGNILFNNYLILYMYLERTHRFIVI